MRELFLALAMFVALSAFAQRQQTRALIIHPTGALPAVNAP
jgi:hypothetical protein